MSLSEQPLFSIISFCKNRASTIRRSVDSVLGQSYANIEFVVQDGASNDGTLEILQEYERRDSRLKLVSQTDSGPAEAFWKVLRRCKGEFIGTCLSDEELLPGVVQTAVERFASEPRLGAITSDGYWSDEQGKVTGDFVAGDFDFVAYLFGRYCPFWPGTFFRRKALLDVGLLRPGWNLDCIEFEIWCRLGTDVEVKYFPGPVSKYAVHPGQASNTPANFHEHAEGRLALVQKMFSAEGFFGDDEVKRLQCMINQLSLFQFHARAYQLKDDEQKFSEQIAVLSRELAKKAPNLAGLSFRDFQKAQAYGQYFWQKIAFKIPASVRRRVPRFLKIGMQRFMMHTIIVAMRSWRSPAAIAHSEKVLETNFRQFLPAWLCQRLPSMAKRAGYRCAVMVFAWLLGITTKIRDPRGRSSARLSEPKCGDEEAAEPRKSIQAMDSPGLETPIAPLHVYPDIAALYEARGQIGQALDMWRRAQPLNDSKLDALACQAILKLPSATYREIAELQKRWALHHAMPIEHLSGARFRPFDGNRRIRIGYHCAFMESDTIRYILGRVMATHDRDKFEVYGYATTPLSPDLAGVFDVVTDTGLMSDEEFVGCVRGQEIDVLVELTGFSPGHRFSAMATRCAPVQVSNLNHHGTSCVPNVDYIISDAICMPPDSDVQDYFTEQIYRLPDCLLCYDYEGFPQPPVREEPPSWSNKGITFGCFGSGGKINERLIEIWATLLRRVPGSNIYVRNAQLSQKDNRRYMADRFEWFGVGSDRLRLEGGTDRVSLLKSYNDVDISLDTWPYCGGNTIGESLWQGVPVVSYLGERFSSRYGASLLIAAGCRDLVATSADEYVDIAADLAGDRDRLGYLRSNLRRMCKENGLGNSTRFARNLERAFTEMLLGSSVGQCSEIPSVS